MAPSITGTAPEAITNTASNIHEKLASITLNKDTAVEEQKPAAATSKYVREPLKLAGVIEAWKHFDVTPVIGREFENVDLADVLKAENSDELIRDLAITSAAPPPLTPVEVYTNTSQSPSAV